MTPGTSVSGWALLHRTLDMLLDSVYIARDMTMRHIVDKWWQRKYSCHFRRILVTSVFAMQTLRISERESVNTTCLNGGHSRVVSANGWPQLHLFPQLCTCLRHAAAHTVNTLYLLSLSLSLSLFLSLSNNEILPQRYSLVLWLLVWSANEGCYTVRRTWLDNGDGFTGDTRHPCIN